MRTMTIVLTAAVLMVLSCAGAPRFAEVQDKDWELIEVQVQPENINFDRSQLITEGFQDIFTLRFDSSEHRINGVGAPNRYFAPYTLGNKQEIAITNIAQTQMIPIHEPEKLKEQDFFTYLQNTAQWNVAQGNLELHSSDENGGQAVLVFVPADKKAK